MRILSVAVGVLLLTSSVWAQSGQLIDVKVSTEKTLGPLKVVEGTVVGPQANSPYPPHQVTVWVNGFSTQASLDGTFHILVPSEPVKSLVAWQRGTNVVVTHDGRALERVKRFRAVNAQPGGQNDVASGGGEGGIRDLLNHPSSPPGDTEVTSGGGEGGIRDLLNKPPTARDNANTGAGSDAQVTSGGGEGGIRDLLRNGKKAPANVKDGGGDGGIRDLLNQPPPQK